MITFRRVAQLNREAQAQDKNNGVGAKKKLSTLSLPDLEPRIEARILALAEALNLPSDVLLHEVIACALGDAHDGFLAAYPERSDRLKADRSLKSRVQELLSHDKDSE